MKPTYYYVAYLGLMVAVAAWNHRKGECSKYLDAISFWLFSLPLVGVLAFRPWGLGLDDVGYVPERFDSICPYPSCNFYEDTRRDFLWYWLIALLKGFKSDASVILWLSAGGFFIKLLILFDLCRWRLLALLFYVSVFWQPQDFTAFRQSLSALLFLIGFWVCVRYAVLTGAPLLVSAGFAHAQAFLSPLVLLPTSLVGRQPGAFVKTVGTSLALIILGLFLHKAQVSSIYSWITHFLPILRLPEIDLHLGDPKAWGVPDEPVRPLPHAVIILSILFVWLSFRHKLQARLHSLTFSSLLIAYLFLWLFAGFETEQYRFFYFFLLPSVFLIGNASSDRQVIYFIVLVSMLFVVRYNLLSRIFIEEKVVATVQGSGNVTLHSDGNPAFPCGPLCLRVVKGIRVYTNPLAAEGYRFKTCEGDVTKVAGGQCDLSNIERDSEIKVIFIRTHQITVGVTGSGMVQDDAGIIRCGGKCEAKMDEGESLIVQAIPADGYRFFGWFGACEGVDAKCRLTFSRDMELIAKFEPVGLSP